MKAEGNIGYCMLPTEIYTGETYVPNKVRIHITYQQAAEFNENGKMHEVHFKFQDGYCELEFKQFPGSPIRRGCKGPCACTGQCKEIIGWGFKNEKQ